MEGNVLSRIRTKYHTFSSSQKNVADYVLNNPDEVILKTLNEISHACGVSETTVLRFLHKIEFNSYQLFKINITQELSKNAPNIVYDDVNLDDTVEQIMVKLVTSTISSLKDSLEIIDPDQVKQLVDRIIEAKKILVIGVGASASIATDMYHKMLKLGFDIVCCNDPHLINILSMNLTVDDLLVVFSHSGESREVLDSAYIAVDQRCKVGAITSYSKSTLAHTADYLLCSSSLETKLRSDAMTSRIIQLMIVDFLYISIVVKFKEKIFPQIHRSRIAVAKNKR